MRKNLIPAWILMLFLVSCSSSDSGTSKQSLKMLGNANELPASRDSSKVKAIHPYKGNTYLQKMAAQVVYCSFKGLDKYQLIDSQYSGDSVMFVSENKNFKYPLGRFNTVKQVLSAYPFLSVTHSDEDPDSNGKVRVYTFKNQGNLIKMFSPGDSDLLGIASGIATTPTIKIFGQIHVGITKKQFLDFFKISKGYLEYQFKVYGFAYVDGFVYNVYSQRQYYTFEGDKLVKIQLVSFY